MNYFLVSDDYLHLIEQTDLSVITQSNSTILNKSMASAIEEVKGFLRNRYDVATIFKTFNLTDTGTSISADVGDWYYNKVTKKYYVCILVAVSQSITNTTYFTEGDPRNPKLVDVTIDVLLYHIHSKISPRNIPELRRIRYDGDNAIQGGGAIGWLKGVQKGNIQPDLPVIDNTDQSTHNIAYGQSDTTKYIVQ